MGARGWERIEPDVWLGSPSAMSGAALARLLMIRLGCVRDSETLCSRPSVARVVPGVARPRPVSLSRRSSSASAPSSRLIGACLEDRSALELVSPSLRRGCEGAVAARDEARRALKLALNESAHRNANERFMRTAASRGLERVAFVCECGAAVCREDVILTIDEYEQIRSHPTWFLVAAGHEDRDTTLERIVDAERGYAVVEKIGSAGEEAARRNPRDVDAA